jgi:hypothetical protein
MKPSDAFSADLRFSYDRTETSAYYFVIPRSEEGNPFSDFTTPGNANDVSSPIHIGNRSRRDSRERCGWGCKGSGGRSPRGPRTSQTRYTMPSSRRGTLAEQGSCGEPCRGAMASTTNYVEHPQLVAERIERFANIVGRERVMAGTDCGFGTFAGFGPVERDIAYLKLQSLVEGAEIASRRLWRR